MMARHRSFGHTSKSDESELPDLRLLDDVVAPPILSAMKAASKHFASTEVRYALVGGLAIGAHGHPRATKDVDFIVGEEAFEHHGGGLVTISIPMPTEVRGVAIDTLSIGQDEEFLTKAIEDADVSGGIPILPIEALVYLKLKAHRKQDQADIVELIKRADLPIDDILEYLEANAPRLVSKFEVLVAAAEDESD